MKLAQIIQEKWNINNLTETALKSTEDIYEAAKSKVDDEKYFCVYQKKSRYHQKTAPLATTN